MEKRRVSDHAANVIQITRHATRGFHYLEAPWAEKAVEEDRRRDAIAYIGPSGWVITSGPLPRGYSGRYFAKSASTGQSVLRYA